MLEIGIISYYMKEDYKQFSIFRKNKNGCDRYGTIQKACGLLIAGDKIIYRHLKEIELVLGSFQSCTWRLSTSLRKSISGIS